MNFYFKMNYNAEIIKSVKELDESYQLENEDKIVFARRLKVIGTRLIDLVKSRDGEITDAKRTWINERLVKTYAERLRNENDREIFDKDAKEGGYMTNSTNKEYSDKFNKAKENSIASENKKSIENENDYVSKISTENVGHIGNSKVVKDDTVIKNSKISSPVEKLKIIPENVISRVNISYDELKVLDQYVYDFPVLDTVNKIEIFVKECIKLSDIVHSELEDIILKEIINKIEGREKELVKCKNFKSIDELIDNLMIVYLNRICKIYLDKSHYSYSNIQEYSQSILQLKRHLRKTCMFGFSEDIADLIEQKLIDYFIKGLKSEVRKNVEESYDSLERAIVNVKRINDELKFEQKRIEEMRAYFINKVEQQVYEFQSKISTVNNSDEISRYKIIENENVCKEENISYLKDSCEVNENINVKNKTIQPDDNSNLNLIINEIKESTEVNILNTIAKSRKKKNKNKNKSKFTNRKLKEKGLIDTNKQKLRSKGCKLKKRKYVWIDFDKINKKRKQKLNSQISDKLKSKKSKCSSKVILRKLVKNKPKLYSLNRKRCRCVKATNVLRDVLKHESNSELNLMLKLIKK